MTTLSASKVLAPRLVRPVVMHEGLIGYPHMDGIEYNCGAESRAVASLLSARLFLSDVRISPQGENYACFYVLAPLTFDHEAYGKLVQSAIANGDKELSNSGFLHALSCVQNGRSPSAPPHANAQAWFDFTQAGPAQNAAFWTFSVDVAAEIVGALHRLKSVP